MALKHGRDEESISGLPHELQDYLSVMVDESGDGGGKSSVCGCVVLSDAQTIVKNETFKETMIRAAAVDKLMLSHDANEWNH